MKKEELTFEVIYNSPNVFGAERMIYFKSNSKTGRKIGEMVVGQFIKFESYSDSDKKGKILHITVDLKERLNKNLSVSASADLFLNGVPFDDIDLRTFKDFLE